MISKFSVKKPYTVLVGVILVIVLGIVSFTKTTTDLLPNISLPYVIVMTTYVGASPETVETVVTKPVEASMATVSNIESINSVSSENYSMVILEFAQSADMNAVSLEIRENLDQVKSYWDDSVGNPIVMKLNPDMLPVMMVAVGVEDMDYADVSEYVKNSVMPEVESLEGVASANAVGLLEETISVIIRQDKVDALNEKIYAAIDEKMKEAEDELAEGKKKLEDGEKELEKGKKELADGQKKLTDGKGELNNGKNELAKKQEETSKQLAEAKAQLLTAKADLEAAKMNMTTNLATAKGLQSGIDQIKKLMETNVDYVKRYTAAIRVVAENSDIDPEDPEAPAKQQKLEAAIAEINQLKTDFFGSELVKQIRDNSPEMAELLNNLEEKDWTDPSNGLSVTTNLGLITAAVGIQLNTQIKNLEQSLNAITNGMGMEAYEKLVNDTIKSMDENLVKVNDGLVELEKGELTAAIEFANASTKISLGEYQMELGQAQLDAAKEQIKTGEEQMQTAKEQLEDGEKQLAEAKETAKDKADMTEILSVDTIKALLTAQNFAMPAGYVTEDGVDYLVRIGDKPDNIDAIKALPLMNLHMDGVPIVTLDEVADVFYTDNSEEIYTNVNGNPGCILSIQKQTGYSTGQVSDLLLARFDKMMKANDKLNIIVLMDQGVYIDLVMDSIFNNIIFGGVLAILILLVFLKDLRPTMVVAFSIPISLVTAIVCMYFSGVTLNVISLSGLALGIGMLVDNSIVVIENIYRLRGEGASIQEAAIKGAGEVTGAIIASTATTVCVFAPIVFTEGITRQLFVDMGLTIAYSLLASLIIALTVVPAMASKLLSSTKEQKEGKIFTVLTNAYSKVLAFALKVKPLVFIVSICMLVISFALAWSNGVAFMSDMDSTQMTVSVKLADDALMDETAAVTDEVVARLMKIDDIEDVGAMASTSSMSLLTGGGNSSTNSTSIYVVTKEDKSMTNDELAAKIVSDTQDLNAEITVDTSSMDMSALGGSGISVQIRGRDIDTLQKLAQEAAAILESVPGTKDVSDGMKESSEELRITVDKDKAIEYGLTVAQVFQQVYPKLASASAATTLAAPEKDYSIYVTRDHDTSLTRELMADFEIKGTDEEGKEVKIPLSEIADLSPAMSLNSISRADQNRYISVSAGIADGYNVGKVATVVEDRMKNFEVPEGYSIVFSGENETIMDAMGQLMLMMILAIVFMYLIMVAQFQSLLSPFIVMFTVPLAFTGGLLALYISGSEISVIAVIGFVMLAGIIVNNGIVLIDYMNQLIEDGMAKKEAIMVAGKTRVRPVLMTALTTILALSTMAFSHDMGSEMGKPMAITTIGGLIYGTLLTLIVVPCVYDIFVKDPKEKAAKKARKAAKKNHTTYDPDFDYAEGVQQENADNYGDGAFAEAEIFPEEEQNVSASTNMTYAQEYADQVNTTSQNQYGVNDNGQSVSVGMEESMIAANNQNTDADAQE